MSPFFHLTASAFSPRGVSSSINGSDAPFTSVLANVSLPADGCTEILPTTIIRNDGIPGATKGASMDRRVEGLPSGGKGRSMDRRKPQHYGSPNSVKGKNRSSHL